MDMVGYPETRAWYDSVVVVCWHLFSLVMAQ